MKNKTIPKTLKAAVLFKYNKPLKICNLKIPNLSYGQVLIKIHYSGICGSQLMEISGFRDTKKWLPHLLGHEASGEVIAIGPGVKKVKINDKVILSWINGKGANVSGSKYKYDKVKINSGPISTFSNFSIISENRIFPKPNNLSFKNAVLFGCAIPTGVGMIFNKLKSKNKRNLVLVAGAGGVGLSAYYALKILGFKNVYLIEKSKNKISLLKKNKFKNLLIANSFNLQKQLKKKSINKFKIFVDTTGSNEMMEKAFQLLQNKGLLLFASHPPNKKKVKIYPIDLLNGKKIIGTRGGECKPDNDLTLYAKIFEKKKVKYNSFFSRTYRLSEINKAIYDMKLGRAIRPLIKMH